MSLRAWPAGFPQDITRQRRTPYESRADSIMYCEVLAEAARDRGWALFRYRAHDVEGEARRMLGSRSVAVLEAPRATLGPPWTKDHRTALAATVLVT
jgi:hypothetical protein